MDTWMNASWFQGFLFVAHMLTIGSKTEYKPGSALEFGRTSRPFYHGFQEGWYRIHRFIPFHCIRAWFSARVQCFKIRQRQCATQNTSLHVLMSPFCPPILSWQCKLNIKNIIYLWILKWSYSYYGQNSIGASNSNSAVWQESLATYCEVCHLLHPSSKAYPHFRMT